MKNHTTQSYNANSSVSVCIHNPPHLVRRPISDIIKHNKKHKFTLLTPKTEKKLHHESTNENVKTLTYDTFQFKGEFAWPIPQLNFYTQLKKAYKQNTVFHTWTVSYPSVLQLILYIKWHNFFKKQKDKRQLIISLDTLPGKTFKFNSFLDTVYAVFNKTLGHWMLLQADTVTVYTKELQQILKKQRINSVFTPTGIERNKVTNSPRTAAKIPKDYVLTVAIPNTRKGIDTVLDIAKQMPKTTFLIAGDGPERKRWEQTAKSQKLTNVKFLGIVNNIPELMQNAKCLLLPSRGEGLAGVIMEAMLYECPVVTSDIHGNRDLIAHTKEGFLANNNQEYIKFIKQIQKSKPTQMLKNAKQKITKEYSMDNYNKFGELYTCVE